MVRCAIGMLVLSAASLTGLSQQIQINKDNKTIAITTSDQAEALADTGVVTVGFHSFGKDQDGTYAEATRTSNAIMSAIAAIGVPKEAIESAAQSLSPIEPENDVDKARYGQGIRYEFSQTWRVTVPARATANVLHVAILSGANDSGNIQWQLKQDDALEAEAASKALEHARQIATRMAGGLGVKLGPLVYASNQTPPRGLLAALGMGGLAVDTASAAMASVKRNLVPLAISPEHISKTATVYAVFAIE